MTIKLISAFVVVSIWCAGVWYPLHILWGNLMALPASDRDAMFTAFKVLAVIFLFIRGAVASGINASNISEK